MKIWLLTVFLALPVLADNQGTETAGPPEGGGGWWAVTAGNPDESTENWVDTSHAYATEQAQALTAWMDDYFGEPNYELEAAQSFLRLDFTTDWDQDDDTNNKVRLRGKVQLPRISRRLNLVFADGSGDELDPDRNERKLNDNVALVYEVAESRRSRFDLTMGINWNRVRPGVRYRYQDTFGEAYSYRLTQRFQYQNGEGFYATSQALVNRALDENSFLRWNTKAVYGEQTDGTEWITRLSLFQRRQTLDGKRKLGIDYFGAINGVTDPESYIRNYRLGVLFRRQIYRKFLFLEVEPAYNYRKRDADDKRQFAWSIGFTLQIALERDLARKRGRTPEKDEDPAGDNISGEPMHAPNGIGGDYQAAVHPLTEKEGL